MAEALGAAGSIIGIAAFGLKSLTTVQAYVDAVSDAEHDLRNLVVEVGATASTLKQLHRFIVSDQAVAVVVSTGKTSTDGGGSADKKSIPVANDEAVRRAVQLATECKQVYTAILNLIAKDIGAQRDENGNIPLDSLDPDAVKTTTLRRLKWSFREPRVRKLREDLRWLKFSLMVQLQVMELGRLKLALVSDLPCMLFSMLRSAYLGAPNRPQIFKPTSWQRRPK